MKPARTFTKKQAANARFCHYCGRGDVPMTCDHIVPKSEGGAGQGFVPACKRCNVAKSSDSYEHFYPFAQIVLRGRYRKLDAGNVRRMFHAWMLARFFADPI